jgi:hypothetical protein
LTCTPAAAQASSSFLLMNHLAAYFTGGLVGSAVLGQAFDRLGWVCVIGQG